MTAATKTLSEERKTFLHGVFTTALEGGIGYWSYCDQYHIWENPDAPWGDLQPDLDGFYAILSPLEGGWGVWADDEVGDTEQDKATLRVDIKVIQRGIRLFNDHCHGRLDSRGKPVAPDAQRSLPPDHYWRQWLRSERTNGRDGDFDADVADNIVQWGLFGEGVYG